MAGEALYTPVLLGLGLSELSMNAVSVPLVKSVVRSISMADCRGLFEEISTMDCAADIEARVRARVGQMLGNAVPREVFDPEQS